MQPLTSVHISLHNVQTSQSALAHDPDLYCVSAAALFSSFSKSDGSYSTAALSPPSPKKIEANDEASVLLGAASFRSLLFSAHALPIAPHKVTAIFVLNNGYGFAYT